MNITLSSDRFLKLPIFGMPEVATAYITMLCLADVSGEVSEDSLKLKLNYSASSYTFVVSALEREGLISHSDNLLSILPSSAWTSRASRKPKTIAHRPSSPVSCDSSHAHSATAQSYLDSGTKAPIKSLSTVGIDLSTRITLFYARLVEESITYNSAHSNTFTSADIAAFFAYWTDHNASDRKFRAEKQKQFYWQSRIATWMSHKSQHAKQPAQSVLSQEREARNARTEALWNEMQENAQGMSQYVHELKLAEQGDEAMRAKYPNYKQLLKRHSRPVRV